MAQEQSPTTGSGGTSSFAGTGITTLSASGGRSGNNNSDPTGNSTGESSNPQAGVYGQGGVGVGGNIVNRRGGRGGTGAVNSSSGYGGGGGSAPAPDGHRDGYAGGNSTSYQGGSGASIYFPGTYPTPAIALLAGLVLLEWDLVRKAPPLTTPMAEQVALA